MHLRLSALVLALALGCVGAAEPLRAQTAPGSPGASSAQAPTYLIQDIRVTGVDNQRTRRFVVQSSGLSTGQRIQLPAGDAIAEAIRSIYDLGLFSDVAIHRRPQGDEKVNLVIEVTPEPALIGYEMQGIKGRHRDDLQEQIPLVEGRAVRPSEIERTKQIIRDFYVDKGFRRTEVTVERTRNESDQVALTFNVDRKKKIEVERIRFLGNEEFDDGALRGAMEKTRENRWWRFWKGEKFNQSEYESDLDKVIDHYREHGYYDARIVKDSVYALDEDGLAIDVTVQEGEKYYVKDMSWEGNTVYTDEQLTQQLGLEEGEPYNGKALEQNLYGSRRGTDVLGMYMNRGYMRADVQPNVRVVGQDSLDITFDVREGEIYEFGDITISGNTKTHDYVVRRELLTVPGERFSRSAIQESIRRLSQLKYFSKQSLQGGPEISVDQQEKEADLTYDVEETGSDQLQLSGTFGRFGLILQLGFTFNNFSAQDIFNASAWRPLPSGDGQKLSLNVRTNGTFYQNYSISFTEPWFQGRPTPVGGSISYSKYTRSFYGGQPTGGLLDASFQNLSANLFVRQRLRWPDNNFQAGVSVGYQLYNNRGFRRAEDGGRGENVGLFRSIPGGRNQSVTVQTSLSRNSLDNPRFPSAGSKVDFSVELAPPVGEFVQYHKWKLESSWNVPLGEDFSVGVGTEHGYIGSITGAPVRFERFEVGGTPFDYQGRNFGTEPIYMRGYPRGVIGPKIRRGGTLQPQGGRILNKYTSEIRWKAVESRQLQARPYLFFDAAGAWNSAKSYNPSNLYRSTGLGVKLYLPIVGMIEVNYGYNFERYEPLRGNDGTPGWTFQFSLGQGF